jgi:tetratricopeptide (TPR) repeat protein
MARRSRRERTSAASAATLGRDVVPLPLLSPGPVAGLMAVFVLVGLVLYSPALHGPFVFDDVQITRSTLYHATSLSNVARVLVTPGVPRRLGRATFALSYFLDGFEPEGYHLVNVFAHAVTGVLLALLAWTLLRLLPHDHPWVPRAAPIALAGAAVWFVHPVQTQAVAYIWQRYTCLSAAFFLACLLAYVRARTGARHRVLLFVASALFGLLALLTKENAGALPLVIVLVESAFLIPREGSAARRWRALLFGVAGFAAIAAVFLGPRFAGMMAADFARRGFTATERLLTQSRVLVHYVSLLALPHPGRLNLDYDVALSRSLLDPPTTLLSALALAAALAVAGGRWRRDRLLSFAILWFFVNQLIESTVIPLDLAHEHRLYIPSMFPIVYVAGCLWARVISPAARGLALGVVLAVLSLWTVERNRYWADPVALLEDTAAKSPHKARVQANLAWAYSERGRLEEASRALERALSSDPGLISAYQNLAAIHLQAGRRAQARALLEEAVRRAPRYMQARVDLAAVCMQLRDPTAAAEHLRRALELLNEKPATPSSVTTYENLGQALLLAGDGASAQAAAARAAELKRGVR